MHCDCFHSSQCPVSISPIEAAASTPISVLTVSPSDAPSFADSATEVAPVLSLAARVPASTQASSSSSTVQLFRVELIDNTTVDDVSALLRSACPLVSIAGIRLSQDGRFAELPILKHADLESLQNMLSQGFILIKRKKVKCCH